MPSRLGRQEVVHHSVARAQRNLAALLPAIHRHGLPMRTLHKLHRSMIQTAMAYDLCTAASTNQGRISLRRQDGVIRAAILKTAQMVHDMSVKLSSSPDK